LLRVYDPGHNKAHCAHAASLGYARSQLGDDVNRCRDDGVRAEVSGRWPLTATVFQPLRIKPLRIKPLRIKPLRIKQSRLNGGPADIDSND
jgi:hypothetical protein